ncbi:MAG TPA: alpha/beta fold hydrolase [Gemmatimonadales bacterium]
MRLALASGESLDYTDEGAGATLLFVHGTPTWSYEWRHLVAALSPRYRCVAPDHLGFGHSDRPADADYTPAAHARRLREFVERLDLRDVTLVVHDYGGPIGIPLALEPASRVRRLVVINSWMWHLGEDPEARRGAALLGGRFGRFLYERFNVSLKVLMPAAWGKRSPLIPDLHRQYLDRFLKPADRGRVLWPLARELRASQHAEKLWNDRNALAGMPALIVWGTQDRALRQHHIARWKEALPDAEVVTVEAGHWPHEEAPAEVAGAMAAFLERTERIGR